uniref:Protein kinase domain-containing protein n=1 Tax=Monopterus albus TaxID=43700 RepID=A0A3Q3K3L5_MONAL
QSAVMSVFCRQVTTTVSLQLCRVKHRIVEPLDQSQIPRANKPDSDSDFQVYQIVKGETLTSSSSTYRVRSFLGQGTFGTVVRCTRMSDMKTVAIKMIKNQGFYAEDAKEEVAILLKLKSLDSDKCNLVRWYQVFPDRGHICLEPIVQQITNALSHLKAVGIMHADLKMENVMFVNHQQEPYKVKVIDLGLACHMSAAKTGSYIQTCPYRSPEVILGLPLTGNVWYTQ